MSFEKLQSVIEPFFNFSRKLFLYLWVCRALTLCGNICIYIYVHTVVHVNYAKQFE